MKYGKSWFHLQFFIIAYYRFLGLFIAKKHVLGEKKNRPSRQNSPCVVCRNLYRQYLSRLKSNRFEISAIIHHVVP
jgi:hypothetical protein